MFHGKLLFSSLDTWDSNHSQPFKQSLEEVTLRNPINCYSPVSISVYLRFAQQYCKQMDGKGRKREILVLNVKVL